MQQALRRVGGFEQHTWLRTVQQAVQEPLATKVSSTHTHNAHAHTHNAHTHTHTHTHTHARTHAHKQTHAHTHTSHTHTQRRHYFRSEMAHLVIEPLGCSPGERLVLCDQQLGLLRLEVEITRFGLPECSPFCQQPELSHTHTHRHTHTDTHTHTHTHTQSNKQTKH